MSPELKAKIDAAKQRAMEKINGTADTVRESTRSNATLEAATSNARPADVPAAGPVANSGATVQVTGRADRQLLHTEGSRKVDESAGAVLVDVATDLQPTTLVVVERPTGRELDSNGKSSGERDDEADTGPVTNLDLTNPVHSGFLQRLGDLETALLARDPLMPTHLLEIHKALQQYEEIAPLLTVEEISKIMAAQQTHVALFLRKEITGGSKAAAAKKTAKVTLEDI